MKRVQVKLIVFVFFLLYFVFCLYSICQTTVPYTNPIKKYDELFNQNTNQTSLNPTADELTLLLPKLDETLYHDWSAASEPVIWRLTEDGPSFRVAPIDILAEAGYEKVLKQTYKKENHSVDVLVYKFRDFTGAYSAFTVFHEGEITKLKVGKNTSESDKLINFWKGNYFVDIRTETEGDKVSKEFIVLFSQDISKNINTEQLPPVVAIQLPALNRIQGSEKYCLGPECCTKFISSKISDFNSGTFNLQESGGVITADYQASENPKDKQIITLILARYVSKEAAGLVFKSLKENYESRKLGNKEIDIDVNLEDGVVTVKNKKNDYTMLKQKGNLLAIAYYISNKKSGEKILDLIPWPIEINRPINTAPELKD